MLSFGFTIEVRYDQDANAIFDILKSHSIEFEQKINKNRGTIVILFDSDYDDHEVLTEIGNTFISYKKFEHLGTGTYDIRIKINIYKMPFSTDNWGRPFNSEGISKDIFYGIDTFADAALKQVTSTAFTGTIPTMNPETNDLGYTVYVFPSDACFVVNIAQGAILFDKIFTTESEAIQATEKKVHEILSRKKN